MRFGIIVAAGLLGALPAPVTAQPCTPPAPRPERDAAIERLVEGDPHGALLGFERALRVRPADRAAEALLGVARERLAAAHQQAAAAALAVPVVALYTLPLDQPSSPPSGAAAPRKLLVRESQKPNVVVDVEHWVLRNQLTHNVLTGEDLLSRINLTDPPPAHVPASLNGVEREAVFRGPGHDVAVYGDQVVVAAPGKRPRVYDATLPRKAGARAFRIPFAQLAGKRLLVQFAWFGDANDEGGRNGYLAAFDADTGKLLWLTEPRVGGMNNFVVAGDAIVTGYGTSDEPDSLQVVNLTTGAVEQRLPLKTAPEILLRKGDKIYVRSYNTDGVYRASGRLPAPPPPELAPAPAPAPARDATASCRLRLAAEAVDRRDPAAIATTSATLGDRPVAAALAALARPPAGLDLSAIEPLRVPPMPWVHTVADPGPLPAGTPPVLERGRAQRLPYKVKARPRFVAGQPLVNLHGQLPENAPPGIPARYGLAPLQALIPAGERLLLLYGGRYLASQRGDRLERIFDLDTLRRPPDRDLQDAEYAFQNTVFATVAGEVLYLCNVDGTFPRFVRGRHGYLTALDATTGRLLWRSAPLTCTAPFAVAGDHLVVGYGDYENSRYLQLIRRADGHVVQRVKLREEPDLVSVEGGNQVVVVGGLYRSVFTLRETPAALPKETPP